MKVQWPSVAVALGGFLVLGAIVVAAILKYDSPDDAMAVFGMLWASLGTGFGLVFAYFFTRGPIAEAMERATDAKKTADGAMSTVKDLTRQMLDTQEPEQP